jgi:HlyD family secretion protein
MKGLERARVKEELLLALSSSIKEADTVAFPVEELEVREQPERGRRRSLEFLLAGLLATSIAAALWTSFAHGSPLPMNQRVETILPASIKPHTLVTMNSEFPGRVVKVFVRAGSDVSQGDALVTVANPEFQLEFERAQAHLEAVRSKLSRLEAAGPTGARRGSRLRSLRAAEERLSNASVDAAQSAYDRQAARLSKLEGLLEQQLATETELEQAREAQEVAFRNLLSEKEHFSRLKEEVEAARSRSVSGDEESSYQDRRTDLLAELHDAEAELQIASQHLGSQEIRATASGTVLRTMVATGDEIPSGIPILQLGQLDRLDFDVPVGADLARRIKVGQPVQLRIPTEPPTKIGAHISEILLVPAKDESPYTVRITVPNPAPSTVMAGLAGEVEFPHAEGLWHAVARF